MAETSEFHTTHGLIELSGEGPWSVVSEAGSFRIVDKNRDCARATLWQPTASPSGTATKPNKNVTWAREETPTGIVAEVNDAFLEKDK